MAQILKSCYQHLLLSTWIARHLVSTFLSSIASTILLDDFITYATFEQLFLSIPDEESVVRVVTNCFLVYSSRALFFSNFVQLASKLSIASSKLLNELNKPSLSSIIDSTFLHIFHGVNPSLQVYSLLTDGWGFLIYRKSWIEGDAVSVECPDTVDCMSKATNATAKLRRSLGAEGLYWDMERWRKEQTII